MLYHSDLQFVIGVVMHARLAEWTSNPLLRASTEHPVRISLLRSRYGSTDRIHHPLKPPEQQPPPHHHPAQSMGCAPLA